MQKKFIIAKKYYESNSIQLKRRCLENEKWEYNRVKNSFMLKLESTVEPQKVEIRGKLNFFDLSKFSSQL